MKKYYKDYRLVSRFLPNGKIKKAIEYTGKHYICRLNRTKIIQIKSYFSALTLCTVITMIGAGFLNTLGSRVFYIALPYACLFLPVVFNLMGVVKLITLKNELEYVAYDKSINRIQRSSIGQLILSSIAVVGDICYLLLRKNAERFMEEIVFLISMMVILFLSILLLRIRKMVIYEVEE